MNWSDHGKNTEAKTAAVLWPDVLPQLCPNYLAAENRPVNLRRNSVENPAEGYLR